MFLILMVPFFHYLIPVFLRNVVDGHGNAVRRHFRQGCYPLHHFFCNGFLHLRGASRKHLYGNMGHILPSLSENVFMQLKLLQRILIYFDFFSFSQFCIAAPLSAITGGSCQYLAIGSILLLQSHLPLTLGHPLSAYGNFSVDLPQKYSLFRRFYLIHF